MGYPGTVINTWQRGGRVGRSGRPSAIVLIAGYDALDQYFLRNPQDFFGRTCEEAILDPMNTEVLRRHLPCAAAEAPIHPDEGWTASTEIQGVLEELCLEGTLYPGRDGTLLSAQRRPQRNVDIRSIGDAFSILREDGKKLIGSASGVRALKECHKGAVYLHRTRTFVVTELDLERHNVLVKPARVNYYTRAIAEKDTTVLRAPLRSEEFPGFIVREANLKVTETITSYEKRRTSSQELIGVMELDLPPIHFHTVGIWIEIPERVKNIIVEAGLHFMGGIHALEHAAISMFPLFALCDRDDIGGISTPQHEQVGRAAVFIYDGHPGGVGLAHRAFDVIQELLEKARVLVENCPCEDGCPSCIHSPKCGSGNKPLDKTACLATLELLLKPDKEVDVKRPKDPGTPLLFPELAASGYRYSTQRPNARSTENARRNPARKASSLPFGVDFQDQKKDAQGVTHQTNQQRAPRYRGSHTPHSCTEFKFLREQEETRTSHGDHTRQPVETPQKGVAVFDLETQKLADEVGGWNHIRDMRLSLGVVHTEEDGFVTFTEENVGDLIQLIKQARLVVGFNQMRFDYEVLSAYTDEDLRSLPNLDILVYVQSRLGHRLSLDKLAAATLGEKKSGSGLQAAAWFRSGEMDLLEHYCRDDVRITRDLYRYGLEKGHLLYAQRGGKIAEVEVDWRPVP